MNKKKSKYYSLRDNVDEFIKISNKKHLLRFITCGSVDDGKSSLIGRLLFDTNLIFKDQLVQLENDSKRFGTQGKEIDYALIVDGLNAEREQGITIDVAYRFFTTEKRKFIVADNPGHEEYTRNMVTGASTAELAIIIIDAQKGILNQTRLHLYLCNLLGIEKIILAINKMDLVNYSYEIFNKIFCDFRNYTEMIGISNTTVIPVSAIKGDNIKFKSKNMEWYTGDTLLNYLETVEISENLIDQDSFCMPVQWVNRPNPNFRGFSGKVLSGEVKPGDAVIILPSGKKNIVDRIVTFDGDLNKSVTGESITLTLKENVDCSRGNIISTLSNPLQLSDQFEMTIIWLSETPLVPGTSYYLKCAEQIVEATISKPKYKVDVNTMKQLAAKSLKINNIGIANVTTHHVIPFKPFKKNKILGGIIFIDKITNNTVAAGLINYSLNRTQNVHWQKTSISKDHHAKIKNQKPLVVWMTGLSGSGKSSISNALEKKMAHMKLHTYLLDGDNLRLGLNKDLGFTKSDRIENIRRVGNVAKLMTDAGLIVVTSLISPYLSEREMVRKMFEKDEFIEVFIDTPLDIVMKRDVKGLYAKAISGKLKNFTGIDSVYEVPQKPDIHIKTSDMSINEAANEILKFIKNYQTNFR